ncbi:OmpP1/FadL family transporter [Vibrio natriegens]|uniref:OmpP1/FadL family transporter n=1 Tax=Vibrio natriegens TaxID=691 RepID=UPI0035566AA7
MQKNLYLVSGFFLLGLVSTAAYSGGFQINEHSASGLGRAFSGDAVIGDNASVISRNAAAMTLFKRNALSFGVTYVKPDVTVNDAQYHRGNINADINVSKGQGIIPSLDISATPSVSQSVFDIDDVDGVGQSAVVPNIYFVHPLNDKWFLGLSAYSNFGTDMEFKPNYGAPVFGGVTSVASVNLGASLAYKVNSHFSVGGGIDVIYGSGELYRDLDLGVCVGGSVLGHIVNQHCGSVSGNALDVKAGGLGIGANLGMMYEINENHRFGLSYKHSPNIDADGDITYAGNSYDSLSMPLPDIAEFSGYHRLSPQMAVHYSVQWIGWSAFDTLKADDTDLKEFQWQDSAHYSIGATWYAGEQWTLRTGYMFDKTPVDKLTSISIPDSNRHWISGGASYRWSSDTIVDFGLTYLIGEDVEVEESVHEGLPAPLITGVTHSNAFLVGVQLSHNF